MEDRPKISDAEWEIMKALWEKSPLTANKIVKMVSATKTWKPKTVRTLINRLVGKGAVAFEKKGRGYEYSPMLAEDECVQAETESFLGRVKGTKITPMLAAFLEEELLSAAEIDELKRILTDKGEENNV